MNLTKSGPKIPNKTKLRALKLGNHSKVVTTKPIDKLIDRYCLIESCYLIKVGNLYRFLLLSPQLMNSDERTLERSPL